MDKEVLLEVQDITMCFPGVKALDQVKLDVKSGEILGLIGENGAGKSTLMNILLGSLQPTAGTMHFQGKEYAPKSPLDALKHGISMIHQEIRLVPTMTVAENVWLGRESLFTKRGILDVKKRSQETKALLDRLEIPIDPDTPVNTLTIATMQLVEVARAVSYNASVIIMDEPTSALTNVEVEKLYRIVRDLAKKGTGIIYISHKLEELFELCDRITVFRDGKYIGTDLTANFTTDRLVAMMVGRDVTEMYPEKNAVIGKTVFECRDLCREGHFKDVSFSVREGEVLGFCGLMGSQRTEIMQSIFGLDPLDKGELYLRGEKIVNASPKQAIENHFALVTEDRLRRGSVQMLSVRCNMSLAYLKQICKMGFVDQKMENKDCGQMADNMRIKAASPAQPVSSLSGGNQQKVIIGKWLLTNPDVLILDEPTRGIDVGAKAEIYKLIAQLTKQRKAILMVSSELPELMGMSDRIMVVREGNIVGEVQREEFSQEYLMGLAFGVNGKEQ